MFIHAHIRKQYSALAGRLLLALIFVASGLGKVFGWAATIGYMNSKGIPLAPFFLFFATLIEIVAGISVLIGYRARLASAVLVVYLIPVTLIFHSFWNLSGADQQIQFINFLKNLSIMGGLLGVNCYGPGVKSLDFWLSHRNTIPIDRERSRIRAVS